MKSKLKNIEELEQQEHSSSAMLNDFASSAFLMNVESEQLEVPPGFDWLLNFSAETVAEASGSS